MGQSTEFMVMVHAVAHDKGVGAGKTREIGRAAFPSGVRGLFQEDADAYLACAPCQQVTLCEVKGPATVENVIDEQDVTPPDVELGIPQKPYIS